MLIIIITIMIILTALLILYTIYLPPYSLIKYFSHRWPDILWYIDLGIDIKDDDDAQNQRQNADRKPSINPKNNKTQDGDEKEKRVIALTIDDAPHPTITPQIRNILKAYNAHATFFVIGSYVKEKEDVLADLVRDGHELANHAMFDEPSRSLPIDVLIEQVDRVQRLLDAVYAKVFPSTTITTDATRDGVGTGDDGVGASGGAQKAAKYFRPGSGFFTSEMRSALSAKGYKIVLGSVYPHDAQVRWSKVNKWHILRRVRPGAIVVCHDGREWTPSMLDGVLRELVCNKGYTVGTVSEVLEYQRTIRSGKERKKVS